MSYVEELCKRAKMASTDLVSLPTEKKNAALHTAASLMRLKSAEILSANDIDIANGRARNMPESLLDRLMLTEERIKGIAEGLDQVVSLPDPIGEILDDFDRPSGIHISKVRVPLGVVGIIYESRPNVTADAFAICLKSGNVAVLKGGSDAIESNKAIVRILRQALLENGVNEDAVNLIESTDRKDTEEFMQMRQYIDVLIPRGSAGLIRAVVNESRIPVIETGSGNCHIYVDSEADFNKAIPIIINAKTQRVGVCNAAESLVVHSAISSAFLPLLGKAMKEHGVSLRADERSLLLLPGSESADETDFGKEYHDYILSVKTVDSLDEAIAHINKYHTGHSDCIITENTASAERFLNEVDSACVYVNASTRFTDGFEFGFGAEIGISTQKLHARGPMGLKELTSYKYLIRNTSCKTGSVRASVTQKL